VKARFGADLSGLTFAVWGLAFKANTDDMREASSLTVIADLLAAGAKVSVYDPVAMDAARKVLGDEPRIRYASSQSDALAGADALVIVTEWKEFRSPNFEGFKTSLTQPVVFDGRNLYDPAHLRGMGIEYFPIGR